MALSTLHPPHLGTVSAVPAVRSDLKVAALFAGVGGIECGFARHGLQSLLLVEKWEPAQAVLRAHFDADIETDVLDLGSLPKAASVVTAGFPCQDLSQAGRTAGIEGTQSGLVAKVFTLLESHSPTWLVLENVQFMLQLDRGKAMAYLVGELNRLGYRWAYRLVDSRAVGVPQRRRRVLLVASRQEDPRGVLFADDAGEPPPERYTSDACGFYWTEGLRGLGWAADAVPTLKGGSTIGIPSPPAVWVPNEQLGRRFLVPTIEDLEALQGLPRGWTEPAVTAGFKRGTRHKLVGNAVTVGVADWLGGRLVMPGDPGASAEPHVDGEPWPAAAWGDRTGTWRVQVSEYPVLEPYVHLREIVSVEDSLPLSYKAAAGFLGRLQRSTLRRQASFEADLRQHVSFLRGPRLL